MEGDGCAIWHAFWAVKLALEPSGSRALNLVFQAVRGARQLTHGCGKPRKASHAPRSLKTRQIGRSCTNREDKFAWAQATPGRLIGLSSINRHAKLNLPPMATRVRFGGSFCVWVESRAGVFGSRSPANQRSSAAPKSGRPLTASYSVSDERSFLASTSPNTETGSLPIKSWSAVTHST